MRGIVFAAVIASCGATVAVQAADIPAFEPAPQTAVVAGTEWRLLDEVRGGVFYHEVHGPEEGSVDINAELLSSRLPLIDQSSAWYWLSPRLHLGGTVNTSGDTSHAYAGLTWTLDVTQAFFIEGSFGGAVHNGETGNNVPSDRNALGCTALFRESASIGYRFTPNLSLMATIEHLSNADLCDQNRGLTNAGLRLGYTF
jgi:lipid A 3-O-deacylase